MPKRQKNAAAVSLGRKGGQAKTPGKAKASRENIQKAIAARWKGQARKVPPCVCTHVKTAHRWQRDNSRAACKLCDCLRYRAKGTPR